MNEDVKDKVKEILDAFDSEEVKEMSKDDDSGIDVVEDKDGELVGEVEGEEVVEEVVGKVGEADGEEVVGEVEFLRGVARRRQERLARLLAVKEGPFTRSETCVSGERLFQPGVFSFFFHSLSHVQLDKRQCQVEGQDFS